MASSNPDESFAQPSYTVLLFGSTGKIGKGISKSLGDNGHVVIPVARKESAENLKTDNYIDFDQFFRDPADDRIKYVNVVITCIGGFLSRSQMAPASQVSDEQVTELENKIWKPNKKVYQRVFHLFQSNHMPALKTFVFTTGTNGVKPESANYASLAMADAKLISFVQTCVIEQMKMKKQKQPSFRIGELRLGLRFEECDNFEKQPFEYASHRIGGVVLDLLEEKEGKALVEVTDSNMLDGKEEFEQLHTNKRSQEQFKVPSPKKKSFSHETTYTFKY